MTNDTRVNDYQLYIGVDGGGTKCKAAVIDPNNKILGVGISGPGNPLYGLQQAKSSIIESASLALEVASIRYPEIAGTKLSDVHAGLGLAGVNIASLNASMKSWESPFKSVHVATDLYVACLGAHAGGDGAVIVSGTGSCGYAFVQGKERVVGAHGFPQGDQASGAWIGLKAVESVLLCLDGVGKSTTITHYLKRLLKSADANDIVAQVASKPPAFFASLAESVFSAAMENDTVALAILDEAAAYLESMVSVLNENSPPRLSFIGGISKVITPFLSKNLQSQLSTPLYPPEVGAAFFVRNMIENNT